MAANASSSSSPGVRATILEDGTSSTDAAASIKLFTILGVAFLTSAVAHCRRSPLLRLDFSLALDFGKRFSPKTNEGARLRSLSPCLHHF